GGDGRRRQLSRRRILRHQHSGLGAVHVLALRPPRLRREEDPQPPVSAARAAACGRAGTVARQPVRLHARVRRAGVRVDGRCHRSRAVQRQALPRRNPAVRPAGPDQARRPRPHRRPAHARQPRAGIPPALSARLPPLHAHLRHRAAGQLQPPADRQQLRQRGALHRSFPHPNDRHAQERRRLRHGAGLRLRPRRVTGRKPPVPARRAARDRTRPADAGTDGDVVLAGLRAPAGPRPGVPAAGRGRPRQPRQPVPHHPRHVRGPHGHLRSGTGPAARLRTGTAVNRSGPIPHGPSIASAARRFRLLRRARRGFPRGPAYRPLRPRRPRTSLQPSCHGLRGNSVTHRHLLLVLSIAGALALSACKREHSPGPVVPEDETADQFIERVNDELRAMYPEITAAQCISNTYITDDSKLIAAKSNERLLTQLNNWLEQAKRFEGKEMSPQTARAINLLKIGTAMPPPKDPEKLAELTRIATEMEGMYGSGTYCKGEGEARDCRQLGELEDVLRNDRDYEDQLDAWRGWHSIAIPMRDEYARFVELANEGARDMGYADAGEIWRSGYDMPPTQIGPETDRLWNQVKPLYEQLHCYARTRLESKYPGEGSVDGMLPAHLMGNMWQ